jgi:hypothetical protein
MHGVIETTVENTTVYCHSKTEEDEVSNISLLELRFLRGIPTSSSTQHREILVGDNPIISTMNAALRAATRLAPRAARQSALATSKAFAPGELRTS